MNLNLNTKYYVPIFSTNVPTDLYAVHFLPLIKWVIKEDKHNHFYKMAVLDYNSEEYECNPDFLFETEEAARIFAENLIRKYKEEQTASAYII